VLVNQELLKKNYREWRTPGQNCGGVRTPHTPVLDIYVGGDRPAVSVGEGGGGSRPVPRIEGLGGKYISRGKDHCFC